MTLSRSSTLAPLALAALIGACSGAPSETQRRQIAAEIEAEVKGAYDLNSPDPVKSFERLYPDTGRVVSAVGGRTTTSRDSLYAGIQSFWQYVGSNMKNPTWMWDQFLVDVLSRDAAVMTATYHVPHTTPQGHPHIIGGVWTAVFRRQSDGRWVIIQEALSDLPPGMADSSHAHMVMPRDTAHGK